MGRGKERASRWTRGEEGQGGQGPVLPQWGEGIARLLWLMGQGRVSRLNRPQSIGGKIANHNRGYRCAQPAKGKNRKDGYCLPLKPRGTPRILTCCCRAAGGGTGMKCHSHFKEPGVNDQWYSEKVSLKGAHGGFLHDSLRLEMVQCPPRTVGE